MAGRTRSVLAESYTDDNRSPSRAAERRVATRDPNAEVRVVGSVDYMLLLVTIVLVLFGVIMVFSSSYVLAGIRMGDPFHFLRRNIMFAAAGFGIMLFLSSFNYELIRPMSTFIYGISVVLLIMVIFFGETRGGATRWIMIPGINVEFQPSEVARAAIIFMMAYIVERYPKSPRTFYGIVFLGGVVGLLVILIALPGGMSVSIITAAIGLALIAVASPHFWKLVAAGGVGGALVGGYLWWEYVTEASFRGGRFGVWLDPFSDPSDLGYQTVQSLYAIAGGRWFGRGMGNSLQASFVPEPHNDIIFSIIVEEFGFAGAMLVLILFAIFIWRGIITSMRAPDTFSSMVALGIVFAIGFQAAINIGVVTNTIPNTGVNLPFISYGGTSLLVSMAMVGVLLNISRYSMQKK